MGKERFEQPETNIAPEAEASIIEMPESTHRNPNDPPNYTDQDDSFESRLPDLRAIATTDDLELPITEYPKGWHIRDDPNRTRQDIVRSYFDAITTKKDEVIALLIENNFVTTETTDEQGRTPLLVAVEAGNVRGLQELMDFGADVNAYGVAQTVRFKQHKRQPMKILRTPLQMAAANGNINLVKLLMETYNADDSLIAPDGELALRLASVNGHRDIVDYLPSRRGGGWRRWKTKHIKAMDRAKKAGHGIYMFFKALLWDIPKFILWSIPKHLIILPVVKSAKWAYNHHKEIPGKIARGLKKLGKGIAKIPKGIWDFIKEIPEAITEIAKWLWRAIKATPKALKIAALWVWNGIKSAGNAIGSVFARAFSFLHTMFAAITSFFRDLTLKNVWEGFCYLLRAIFIDGPVKLWQWLKKFGDMSCHVLETLFGCVGTVIWLLGTGIFWLFAYVPKKLMEIIISIGQSIGKAFTELLIWINPKR